MRCWHCYTPIIEVQSRVSSDVVCIQEAADPSQYTPADACCIPGDLRITHKPLPKIEVPK